MLQGVRFAVAAVLVGMYTWKDIRASSRRSLKAGLVLGILLGIAFALQTVGLTYTSASRAGFLTGTMVVFTPLLQLLVERRKPDVANLLGVVIVGAGLYVFFSPGAGGFGLGDVLVLLCAIVFAFYIVYLDIFTHEHFDREIVAIQFIVTSAIGFLLSPFLDSSPVHFTGSVLLSVLYLALFASAIAIFVQSKYQRETTPTHAAIIFTMEPVFASLLAMLILGEIMSIIEVLGAAIMFFGLVTSEILGLRYRNTGT